VSGRPPRRETANVVLGILLLARFDRTGLRQFGATAQSFLASLAPLLAFPLVGGLLLLAEGQAMRAALDLFAAACALLAPAVLSHALAAAWSREAEWLRYATAFNWCQWAIPIAATGLVLLLAMLTGLGLSDRSAAMIAVAALVCYGLSLHWFVARHGLALPPLRAGVLVVGVNFGTAALLLAPRLLAWSVGAAAF